MEQIDFGLVIHQSCRTALFDLCNGAGDAVVFLVLEFIQNPLAVDVPQVALDGLFCGEGSGSAEPVDV